MNIFILDKNTVKSARYHCNTHVIKMPLELAQILCTISASYGYETPMKPTHKGHPCTIWAGKSYHNFIYTRKLAKELCKEYKLRYGKTHSVEGILDSIIVPDLPRNGLTPFAMAMPDVYRGNNPIESYRKYYVNDKLVQGGWRFSYKARKSPEWINDNRYKVQK